MRLHYMLVMLLLVSGYNSDKPTAVNHVDHMSVPSVTIRESSVTLQVTKPRVIVLPPFDKIASEGISPDVQKYLENEIAKDAGLALIRFPFKELMDVPYHNVYDKKYCKPILDKVNADIVVMSKLDLATRTGRMETDTWDLSIRIYGVQTGSQTNLSVMLNNVKDFEIRRKLSNRQKELVAEIKASR